MIDDPTYADAILDRLVHNAYRIELRGDSRRRKGTDTNSNATATVIHSPEPGKDK